MGTLNCCFKGQDTKDFWEKNYTDNFYENNSTADNDKDVSHYKTFNSYIINSKLNKHYQNEDSGENIKRVKDRFALIYTKKTSANNTVILKKSKSVNERKINSKEKKESKIAENKKSIISLGVKKQYSEDD